MERKPKEKFESYKKRRARVNRKEKEYLEGSKWHGFRTFKIIEEDDGSDSVTDIVESEFREGESFRVGRRVQHDLTIKNTDRVKGYEKCRCGSPKLTKNCCGTRLKEEELVLC